MLEQTIVDDIFAELKADHDELSDQIIEGTPETYDKYRELVGLLAGNRRAADIIRAVLKKFQQTDSPEE